MINTLLLKAAIVEAGYTQASLSKKLDMSENTLSAKINGHSKFFIDEATAICKLLNITDEKKKVQIFLA